MHSGCRAFPVLCCLLLCLLPVLLLPASTAAAAPATPYKPDTVLRARELTGDRQTLLDLLYQSVLRHDAVCELPPRTDYTEAQFVMNALTSDYPELIELNTSFSLRYYENEPQTATAVIFDYRLTKEEADARREAMLRTVGLLSPDEPDEFIRERRLYDALLDRTVYTNVPSQDTADGPLLDGAAVCGGYAKALCLMLRLNGIACSTVSGTANGAGHIWCAARINGTECLIDPTWDDQDALGVITYAHFNVSWAMLSQTHAIDDGYDPSMTSDVMEFYRHEGYTAASLQEAKTVVLRQKSFPIYLRLTDPSLSEAVPDKLTGWLQRSIRFARVGDCIIVLAPQ